MGQNYFKSKNMMYQILKYIGGGFKYFNFHPEPWENRSILTNIFFKRVVQPPTSEDDHLKTMSHLFLTYFYHMDPYDSTIF